MYTPREFTPNRSTRIALAGLSARSQSASPSHSDVQRRRHGSTAAKQLSFREHFHPDFPLPRSVKLAQENSLPRPERKLSLLQENRLTRPGHYSLRVRIGI